MYFTWRRLILGVGILTILSAWFYTLFSPLEGIHSIRQADTLFAGYSYCKENTEFLKPKIAHRENTSGVAIGELPLFSYLISIPCQVTGEWNEWSPKIITWILLLLSFWVWSLWFQKYYPERWPGLSSFAILFFLSTQVQVHWAIPIPDVLVVFTMGWALLCQSRYRFFSICLFALSFWIRPYYLPLLALVERKSFWPIYLAPCLAIYFFWYKKWILISEIEYYNTRVVSLHELWQAKAETLKAITERILRNELNFVGLVFLYFASKKIKYDFWIWSVALGSLAFIVFLKGPHLINHGYYLGAFSIMAIIVMSFGLKSMGKVRGNILLGLYFLILVVNVQHHWGRQGLEMQSRLHELLVQQGVAPKAKIATFTTSWPQDPTFLYLMKHTGWAIAERDFNPNSPCPKTADYYLVNEDKGLALHPCPK